MISFCSISQRGWRSNTPHLLNYSSICLVFLSNVEQHSLYRHRCLLRAVTAPTETQRSTGSGSSECGGSAVSGGIIMRAADLCACANFWWRSLNIDCEYCCCLLIRQRSVLLSIFQFMIGDVLVIKQELFLSVCLW
jgi:hypothetical protein